MADIFENKVSGPIKRLKRDKGFVMALAIMLLLAIGFQVTVKALEVNLAKKAIPLQKNFDYLSEEALKPFVVTNKRKITNEDMEAELGTEDYIDWGLADPDLKGRPGASGRLFVTYYTGSAGKVPHIPDACYAAGGSEAIGSQTVEIKIPGIGVEGDKIEVNVRYFRHKKTDKYPEYISSILYFFNANGEYALGRNRVRQLTHSWRDKYAYFCKVELTFGAFEKIEAQELIGLAEKYFGKVIPELQKSHWPVWPPEESVEKQEE